MRAPSLVAFLWSAVYPADPSGQLIAGTEGAAICETTQQLRKVEKAVEENDQERADSEGCTFVPPGAKIEIIQITEEPFLAGSSIVRARASAEYGQAIVGYASRGAIIDKK